MTVTQAEPPFTFAISLSVLNHLGRQLYRSFATVLGEAISNSWDADARNVRIYLDREGRGFWIKDDGVGMTAADFQQKFLTIGYSKRKDGSSRSPGGRPYIGRKGIGKLALLSCADRISILSKVQGGSYVGGTIDNSELDKAITEDLTPQNYRLGDVDTALFAGHAKDLKHGTIIRFDGLKDGVQRSLDFLRKMIALYFRFSLLDSRFSIFLDGTKVTHKDLADLVGHTEFLWKLDSYDDPFVTDLVRAFAREKGAHESTTLSFPGVKGFLASVKHPRYLKVLTTGERIGVDLFVNGRLRERDVLKHIPTASIVEDYLYGQLHFDALDDGQDRFTSSREGIVADDPKFSAFLKGLRKVLTRVLKDWDDWRTRHREEGDPDNTRLSKAQRASAGLYNAVSKEFEPVDGTKPSREVDGWVAGLRDDAAFNFQSYAECFVSENLIRTYITERKVPLSPEAKAEAKKWKEKESANKSKGNISIAIRRKPTELSYLSMDDLANLVDKRDPIKDASLARDANEFKPMRDAVAHTALLTDVAKARLLTVRENIKSRLKSLLTQGAKGHATKTPPAKGRTQSKPSKG